MSDIIRPIEPFLITQGFGDNPKNYAKYNLKGHNGWDLRTKYPDTPDGKRNILSSWESRFYGVGDEGTSGYGKYLEVIVKLYSNWKLTYAHCDSRQEFETKHEGEGMAISDNTGNSTAPHTHFTAKKGSLVNKTFKVLNYNNGYFGAVNPQEFFDELRKFKFGGGDIVSATTIAVDAKTYEKLVGNSSKWDQVVKYLEIQDNPDETPYPSAEAVIGGFKSRTTDLQNQLIQSETELSNRIEQVSRLKDQVLQEEELRKGLQSKLTLAIKTASDVGGLYEARIKSLQGQVNLLAIDKGQCLIELEKTKKPSKTAELIKNVLLALIKKLARR